MYIYAAVASVCDIVAFPAIHGQSCFAALHVCVEYLCRERERERESCIFPWSRVASLLSIYDESFSRCCLLHACFCGSSKDRKLGNSVHKKLQMFALSIICPFCGSSLVL